MNDAKLETIEEIERFLKGSHQHEFAVEGVEEKEEWIEDTLIKFSYLRLKRREKGVVREYIRQVTRYSRAQTERLIREYRRGGEISKKRRPGRKSEFQRKYTDRDIDFPPVQHAW